GRERVTGGPEAFVDLRASAPVAREARRTRSADVAADRIGADHQRVTRVLPGCTLVDVAAGAPVAGETGRTRPAGVAPAGAAAGDERTAVIAAFGALVDVDAAGVPVAGETGRTGAAQVAAGRVATLRARIARVRLALIDVRAGLTISAVAVRTRTASVAADG